MKTEALSLSIFPVDKRDERELYNKETSVLNFQKEEYHF